MASDFFGAQHNSTKPNSQKNISSFQNKASVAHPPYSVYERSLGQELLSPHISNPRPDYAKLFNKRMLLSKRHARDPNNAIGIGNFDALLSNVAIKRESSLSFLLEDTTDRETIDRTFCAPTQQLLENLDMCKPHETKGRNGSAANSRTNLSQHIETKHETRIGWPESGTAHSPYKAGSTCIYDEQGSTKDSSIIENNLAHNRTFLRNLENLTTILHEPSKSQRTVVQTKYMNIENSNNPSSSAVRKASGNQPAQFKERRSVNYPNVLANVSVMSSTNLAEKNYPQEESQYYYGITNQTSNNVNLAKGRSSSAMNTRREVENFKDQRNSHQQSQRDKSYNPGLAKQEERSSVGNYRNTPGPRAEGLLIQQKEEITPPLKRDHSKGHINQTQDSSKNLPIQKLLKNTLNSGTASHSQSRSTSKHHSYNIGYNVNNNKLNYGQIKLAAEPVEDFTDLTRRKENSMYQRPYWQLKKTSAKLEASKKNLVNSLMKNNHVYQNLKDIYSIEGINKPNNPAFKGIHERKSHDNSETIYKQSSSFCQEAHAASNDGIPPKNANKKTTRPSLTNLSNPAAETKNVSRKEVKSVDTKRCLSGRPGTKPGDEPGKENSAHKHTSKASSQTAQLVKKFDPSKTPSAKEKLLYAREGTQYTLDESTTKKEENDEKFKYIPQLLRGRTMIKYRESPDDDDLSPMSSDLKNQASSKSFTYSKPEQTRPLSESRSNSKDILRSLKDFSYGFVKSTKEFFLPKYQKPRIKCKCVNSLKPDAETCPKAQKWLFSKYRESELEYLKKTYEKIRDSADIDPRCNKQIGLDIKRTYPECEFFASNSEGLVLLERILQCYAMYDPKIGYVQGMNFIAAAILYHAEEYIAFWILVLIFEKSEMRDVYMQDLPGLAKHSQIVDFLILNNLPELYSHFCTHNITVEMFCTEWIFGLFGSVIPVEKMDCFIDGFVDQGWLFFYKFVLALLKNFEKELMEASDMSEILIIFKSGINKRERNVFTGGKENVDWEKMVKYAYQIELDNSFIHKMLMVFDQETKRFLLNPK